MSDRAAQVTQLIAEIIEQWNTDTLPDYHASFKKTGSSNDLARYIVHRLKVEQWRVDDQWPHMDRDWGDGSY